MKNIKIIGVLVGFLFLCVSCDTSEKDLEVAKKVNSFESYSAFIRHHPNSELADVARDSIVSICERMSIKKIPSYVFDSTTDKETVDRLVAMVERKVDSLYQIAEQENTISAWQNYTDMVPQVHIRDAYERKTSLVEEAYQKAERANTIEGWQAYIKIVSVEDMRDASVRIVELKWGTEANAWKTVSSRPSITTLQKYLELYPKGKHAKQAEKILIDLEVASVFAGEHGILPAMDKGNYTGASYSKVEIENQTQYDLTVSYSGPDSKRMVIAPHATKSIRIGNGNYRVAASVGHGVIPFAGTETLNGRHFSSSFYIETKRW